MAAIDQVRLYLNDEEIEEFTPEQVQNFLDTTGGNVFAAASIGWMIKAGRLAKKINVSTSQTRLELSKQHDQAMSMQAKYEELAGGIVAIDLDNVFESVAMATADPADPDSDAYWPGAGAQYSDD